MPEDTARRSPTIIGHNDGTLVIQNCLPDATYDVQGAVLSGISGIVDRLNAQQATIDALTAERDALLRWKNEALPLLAVLDRCHDLLPASARAALGTSMAAAVEAYLTKQAAGPFQSEVINRGLDGAVPIDGGFSTTTVTRGDIPTTGLDLIFGRPDARPDT